MLAHRRHHLWQMRLTTVRQAKPAWTERACSKASQFAIERDRFTVVRRITEDHIEAIVCNRVAKLSEVASLNSHIAGNLARLRFALFCTFPLLQCFEGAIHLSLVVHRRDQIAKAFWLLFSSLDDGTRFCVGSSTHAECCTNPISRILYWLSSF